MLRAGSSIHNGRCESQAHTPKRSTTHSKPTSASLAFNKSYKGRSVEARDAGGDDGKPKAGSAGKGRGISRVGGLLPAAFLGAGGLSVDRAAGGSEDGRRVWSERHKAGRGRGDRVNGRR